MGQIMLIRSSWSAEFDQTKLIGQNCLYQVDWSVLSTQLFIDITINRSSLSKSTHSNEDNKKR